MSLNTEGLIDAAVPGVNLHKKSGRNMAGIHDDVIKWKHFPRYLPEASDAELWCFFWSAP